MANESKVVYNKFGRINWRLTKQHSCGVERVHNDRYDTYFCPNYDEWLEPECTCAHNDCGFQGRPDKPSEVK